ncbi:hypothetical protein [Vibrio gigantis]|uniref:hypothetical protein n=1 Tax=Vibrio gigantis TaxID=296199 RepID=UPI001BFEC5A0|nr:hypothetical protein [Vibrio gigantis]
MNLYDKYTQDGLVTSKISGDKYFYKWETHQKDYAALLHKIKEISISIYDEIKMYEDILKHKKSILEDEVLINEIDDRDKKIEQLEDWEDKIKESIKNKDADLLFHLRPILKNF